MSEVFENDFKDRKRRFLRGLNILLGLNPVELENKDILLRDAIKFVRCKGILGLRNKLANVYCLEFTKDELLGLFQKNMTTGDFTEKYCEIVYKDRGKVNLDTLMNNSISKGAINRVEIDKSPKYGLNGSRWCDVAEGPCSCGAWH